MKVLIVDDREDNRLLLREQLRLIDAEAVTADSGARALREMRNQRFDLVVTDLLMPEMDGFQLCYLLKSDPNLQNTPVVIYTANYATRKDEEQAKSLGADDFITRPIDEEQLAARIQRVVRESGASGVARPSAKPEEGFFREYSSLLIEKLEDQLITAEENARLLAKNVSLQTELQEAVEDLRQTNADLVQANADLEAYTYSVSHDLRAPIRGIRGMLDLLVESLGSNLPDEARDYIKRIKAATDRLDAMINGLLAHSRMRHVGEHLVRVELESVVALALATLEFAIAQSGAAIEVTRPLPAVCAHEAAVTQILTNLIDNALKFTAPGTAPRVEVSTARHGDRVRVSVKDHGIGIASEYHDRVYKVFERLQSGAQYPGSGIGLAIVKRGVERMGGASGFESTPGTGSTFWIELPAADE